MPKSRLRVGLVGLQAGRSWGAMAHIPAIRALADDFEIVGVANTSQASAQAAADAAGIPRAFKDVEALVTSSNVDIVTVTVKVPHHKAIVSAALEAGKAVYCEWPLGNGLAETRELAALASARGVLGVVGAQALFAPEILHLRELLATGYVGEVLSTTLVGTGTSWGPVTNTLSAYTLDPANGANLLTIPLGHTLAALDGALGEISELSAIMATRRRSALNIDTGDTVPILVADQVLSSGLLGSGAPISIHYRGGAAHGAGLIWDISGSEGDLRLSGASGHSQLTTLALYGGHGADDGLKPIPLPAPLGADASDGPIVGNVRRLYSAMSNDIRNGTHSAPTFDDAVRIHRNLEAIERAAVSGARIRPSAV